MLAHSSQTCQGTNPLPREKAARMLALRGEDCSQLD
jgi:hypothetical protein